MKTQPSSWAYDVLTPIKFKVVFPYQLRLLMIYQDPLDSWSLWTYLSLNKLVNELFDDIYHFRNPWK